MALPFAAGVAQGDDLSEATELFRNLDSELRVTGMTFVGSRAGASEFVVRAERAVFLPENDVAQLEDVEVLSETASDEGRAFAVRCDRGELDVMTNDFLAEGNVRGQTGDGQFYEAPWVRYEHERALLYTDAPVVMQDDTGRFRGDGFRYFVKQGRFRLLGNVSLEQVR
ncbi:MAG: LPS export ABC transporter periplasmic protein LptC [Myxococcota bacterium]|nr:LPS export ABC transporter periplasmic protein LptC [Myxococcota bacterium]